MISANELRIGNYLIDQYGDIGKVVGINSDKEYKHNGQLFVGTATLYYDNFKGSIGRWIQIDHAKHKCSDSREWVTVVVYTDGKILYTRDLEEFYERFTQIPHDSLEVAVFELKLKT